MAGRGVAGLGVRLETPRLVLRPPALDDLDRWAEMTAHAEATRFVGGVQTRSAAWRGLMTMAGAWALTGVGMFSLLEKAGGGRWVGRAGPWRPEGWPGNEVGWALHPDAWGKGYATEAAEAALGYAFDRLGWDEVIHCIDPANAASRAVARRLGSTLRGPGRMPPPWEGEPVDIWGQNRADWSARRDGRALTASPAT